MANNDYLYHFTSRQQLDWILEDGYLKLTPSNLKEPKHIKKVIDERGVITYADPTDFYKPVVWLTENPEPKARENGLSDIKTEVRITVKKTDDFKEWDTWALKNGIKVDWYKRLTAGCDHNSWWISTVIIPKADFIKIEVMGNEGKYKDFEEKNV